MGASRAAAEAAQEGELQPLSLKYWRKVSVGANNITGTVSTVVILSYALFAQAMMICFGRYLPFLEAAFLLSLPVHVPRHTARVVDGKMRTPIQSSGWYGGSMGRVDFVCFLVVLSSRDLVYFP